MLIKNFLTSLVNRLSPDIFRPIPEGLLYVFLQTISREISGECPWDKGDTCFKGYDSYWYVRCRNSLCPGYRHPLGLISYTSRSSSITSIDNRFDYSTIRYLTLDDYVEVGTLGAMIKFDFGAAGSIGGYGVGHYGALYWNDNSNPTSLSDVHVGDKWTITCTADTQIVGPAVPDPGNLGSYGPINTKGPYMGDHDTVYTVELIDFWGYIPNFENALLQMCLATCDGVWVDFWGEYFGIKRLLTVAGYEDDETYKARILKEITRAKGTKPVLLEEAKKYFNSEDVSIIEYCQVPDLSGHLWDGPNLGFDESGAPDPDRAGLQPYQFYIYPPVQRAPSAKFVATGSNLKISGSGHCYTYVGGYAYYGYSYGDFSELTQVAYGDFVGNWLFIPPVSVDDAVLFGNLYMFSGVYFDLSTFAVGGSYVWEYWNGVDWTTLTVSDTTLGFTQDGWVWWKLPGTTWVKGDNIAYNIPNVGVPWFWVRCRVTASPTVWPEADLIELGYAGATNRGRYCASGAAGYNPVNRDINNCYIYRLGSWEKPLWESGLQNIIDRLKTAGTICIINPQT